MRIIIGLLGLLVVVTGLLWLVLARPLVFSVKKRAVPAADPQILAEHVRSISTCFGARDWTSSQNLERVAEHIHSVFSRFNSKVSYQVFEVSGREYRNVISEYSAPGATESIVVGAHYDTDGPLPGADDNASGVAGVMELARLLAGRELPSKVLLVAYPLEEMPFFATPQMGSSVHARSLVEAKEPLKLMISLEMIGYFSDAPGSQSYPLPLLKLFYPSRGNFIAVVGRFSLSTAAVELKRAFLEATNLDAFSINAPALIPGVSLSDHRSYWQQGFDAVMITDTAFFRNFAYHTASDTADRLDFSRMAEVVTGVAAYLSEPS